MQTMIDELMNESMQETSCSNGSCGCRHCSRQRNQEFQEIQQELESLELNLEEEEELELSKIFARAKALLKKGIHKSKPAVAGVQALLKFIFGGHVLPPLPPPPPAIVAPAPPRDPVNADMAKWMEEQRRRKMEEDVKARSQKTPMVQKPQKESSLMQELLMEQGF